MRWILSSQPSVKEFSVTPLIDQAKPASPLQWLPKHLERGVIAVIIAVLGFGVWLGWVLKPKEMPLDTTVVSVATVPTDIAPSTPETSKDYWFGPAGLVRTAEQSQTAQAAMVTLFNQWNRLRQPNLEMTSNRPESMQIDSFPFELSLLERLDYPGVMIWRASEHAPLTSAVLFAMNADTATILDPLHGVLHVKRKSLVERVVGGVKIFWKPLSGLSPSFPGEDKTTSLTTLQQHLGQLEFGNTNEDATVEEGVEAGVRALQQFYGFKPTGIFTKEVHLVLGKEIHGQEVPSLMLPLPYSSNFGPSAGSE
jgi:hypothetical protein